MTGNNESLKRAEMILQWATTKMDERYELLAEAGVRDIASFNRYNPNFDKQIAVKGTFDLRLPADKMDTFNTKKYQILEESLRLLLAPVSD